MDLVPLAAGSQGRDRIQNESWDFGVGVTEARKELERTLHPLGGILFRVVCRS